MCFGNVCIIGLESVSPEMRARFGIDKLHIDPHPITGSPHASFQHVPDTQFTANLFHVDGFEDPSRACTCMPRKGVSCSFGSNKKRAAEPKSPIGTFDGCRLNPPP